MKIYVSGPMRGVPQFGHPIFERAACALRGQGHVVCNPHEKNEVDGFDFTGYDGTEDLTEIGFDVRVALAADLQWICQHADAVVILPGWHRSRGACAEVAAALALDIPVWRFRSFVLEGIDARKVTTTWVPPFSREDA